MLSLLLGVLLHDLPTTQTIDFSHIQVPQERVVWEMLPEAGEREFLPPIKNVIDGKESLGIDLTARSAIVVDVKSGKILFEKGYDTQNSIASITKLMTALVFVDHNPGWEKEITLEQQDERVGAAPKIYRGESVSIHDLFYSSLVGSDNNATIALVRATGLGEANFVKRMNEKAAELGLEKTYFVEPTGLHEGNISTALDVSKLIYHATQHPKIAHATTQPTYTLNILNKDSARRIYNTDKLLDTYINQAFTILGGKTGFTYEAGSCLGIAVKDKSENDIIVVVMGSKNNEYRFKEVKGLTQWTFDNYTWR